MFLFKKNVRVVVKNLNLALELKTGTNLYQALVSENIIPPSLCKGNGQCGKCKVHITQRNLSRPNKREKLVLAPINLDAGFRLACQTTIKEDMTIDTSEITSSHANEEFVVRSVKNHSPQPVNTPSDSGAETAVPERQETAEKEFPAEDMSETATTDAAANVTNVTGEGHHRILQKTTTPPVMQGKPAEEPVDRPQHAPPPKEPSVSKTDGRVKEQGTMDGLLLVQNKGQLRYFLYSAAIDTVSQEGTLENTDLSEYIHNGTLTDFVHDRLKIKDIDRIIVLSDEPSGEGEHIFDMISYTPFDIGPMPCELIRPLYDSADFSLFLRLLSQKSKNRLLISLDKLDHCYFIAENKIVRLPDNIGPLPANLFDITNSGTNPIVGISDDFKTITCQKEFLAPDSLPLPMLMRTAGLMVKNKLADSDLQIYPRSRLGEVPLDYIVKIVRHKDANAFYLFRNKEVSLLVTQEMLSALVRARNYMHYAVDYTEANLGNIETIIVCTPTTLPSLLENIGMVGMVPPRHQSITVHNSGDTSVMAVKLFQEADVRTYIHKNYGTFIVSE